MSLLYKSTRNLSLEVIDIQDASFGKQIEAIVGVILSKIADDKTYTSDIKDLQALIFKRLGLKVKLNCNSRYYAAILPFYINKNHIFLKMFLRGNITVDDQEKIIKAANDKKGFVDLKRAKVGGVFSEYTNALYINFAELYKSYKLTSPEITAVILHELGHGMYACEYSDRIETTNQVLANVAKEALSDKKEKNLTYIYRELKSIDDTVTEKTVEDIVKGTRVIAGYQLFKVAIHSVQAQLIHGKYDETSFESLADNFAARFQYGRELVIALEKLHDYFGNPEKGLVWNTLGFTLSVMWLLFLTALIIASFSSGPIAVLYFGIVGSINFLLAGESAKDYTYDDLKVRYKRVRNEQIALLKELDLTNEELESLLESIYFMDKVINSTYEYRGLMSRMANLILPFNRKTVDSVREQQLLEDLTANGLFVMSAQYKLLNQ